MKGQNLFVLDVLMVGIARINRAYIHEEANKHYCVNLDRQHVIGHSVADVWGAENFTQFMKTDLDRCFSGEEVRRGALLNLPMQGQDYYEILYLPYFGSESNVTHAAMIVCTVTEPQEMESISAQSEDRFKDLRKISTEPIALIEDGLILESSDAFNRFFGYEGEDLQGRSVTDVTVLEHRILLEEMMRERTEDTHRTMALRRNGDRVPVEVTFRQVRAERRNLWVLIVHELTRAGHEYYKKNQQKSSHETARLVKEYQNRLERLVIEQTEEIKKGVEIYRSVYENAVEGMFRAGADGRLISANPALAKLYGFDRVDDLLEKAWKLGEIYAKPKDRKRLNKLLRDEGVASGFETELYTRNGSTKWARMNVRAEKDEKGDILYYEGTLEDITERKRAEDKYKNIFLNATEGIFQITPEGRYLSANPALARIRGFDSPEDLIRSTGAFHQQFHIEKQRWSKCIQLLNDKGYIQDFECQAYKKDGGTTWVSLNIRAVRSENRQALFYEGTVRDITERRLATEQIMMQRDLALQLAQTGDVQKGLTLILEAAVKASGMESGGIWLKKPETENFELISSINLSTRFERRTSTIQPGSPIWRLMTSGKSIFAAPTAGSMPSAFDEGYKYGAVIPVICDAQLIASFQLFSRVRETISDKGLISVDFLLGEVGSIIARIQVQQRLEEEIRTRSKAEKALQIERLQLEEANIALKVLLRQREKDREELEERFVSNVNQLVLPYVEKLKKSRIEGLHRTTVEFIETHLKQIVSPFIQNIRSFNLTPRQLEIVTLIKEGRTTKEIADHVGVSKEAVDMQRFLIRKKLGLNKDKTNLRSFLLSLRV